MKIILSPQRRNDTLALSCAGDVLSINGEDFDFTDLPDGAVLPMGAIENEWVAGAVSRESGELIVPVILPLAADAPEARRFPDDLIDPPDGPITLPGDET